MNMQAFMNALRHENPLFRLNAARSLGMVAEVDAFEPMGVVFQQETDPEVKQAMHWAGKEILKAKQSGITTIDRVFEVFNINQEILNMPDPSEEKLMQTMQDNLDRDLLKMKKDGLAGQAGLTIAAGLAGSLVGGAIGGVAASTGAAMNMARSGGISHDYDRSTFGSKRIPATRPTDASIKIWSQRLLSAEDPALRITAARELWMINNPAAVPNLANAYLNDPVQEVRDEAYRCGVELYLKMRYWEFHQDGTLDDEFRTRALAAGKIQTESTPPFIFTDDAQTGSAFTASGTGGLGSAENDTADDDALKETPPEEIAEILRRAEENRAKRSRNRR